MSAPRRIDFVVLGIAQPKGSARAFVPLKWAKAAVATGRAPRAIVTHDNPQTKGWQQLVAEQAQTVVADGALFLGPVVLTVTFRLPRPASLPQKVRHHTKKPDLDKLVRGIEDGLTGIVYLDDKQVVDLYARKVYVVGTAAPSVRIVVEEAAAPEPEALDLFADSSRFTDGRRKEDGNGEEAHEGQDRAHPRHDASYAATGRRAARHGRPRDQTARGGR
jgi:Holliday junction resolvase RusA-like endonuclease